MKNKEESILSFWLSCIREQDIQKTELNNSINAHQFISLDSDDNFVSNQRDSVRVSVSQELSKILKSNKKSLMLRNNNDSRPVFFFPLIEIKGKLSPLFFVDLSEYEAQLISGKGIESFEINPWSVDTKIGVVTDTFVRMGYDEDHINLDDSIISFIESITGDFTLNFNIAMESLLEYLSQDALSHGNNELVALHKGVLKYSDFSESTLIFKKDILTFIENKTLREQKVFQDFLFRKESSKEPINQRYYGTFQPDVLSEGQAESLSKLYSKNESIIAVQGPPGTGKTTMIMSAIAGQITQRAIAIAKDEETDMKPILVTSFTNKAVENIIELLENRYKEDVSYFLNITIGNREKRIDAAHKISSAISKMESTSPDIELYRNIKEVLSNYESLFSNIENNSFEPLVRDDVRIFSIMTGHDLSDISDFDELLSHLSDFYKCDSSYASITEVIESLIRKYNKQRQDLAMSKLNLKKQYADYKKLISKYPIKSPSETLMSKEFYKVRPTADEVSHPSESNSIFTTISILFKTPLKYFGLISESEKNKTNSSDSDNHLKLRNAIRLSRLSPLYEILNKIKGVNSNLTTLEKRISLYTSGLDKLTSIYGKQPLRQSEFRIEHSRTNYDLFELSLKFLIQHILLNRDKLTPILEKWKKHINPNESARDFDTPSDDLAAIGNVFPIITCTLSSLSHVIPTSDNYFINNKCFSLAICDESGMVPIYCMPSLLLRSERVMVVGDQKQLSPVINIDQTRILDFYKKYSVVDNDNLYHPLKASAFQRSAFCISDKYKETGNSIILNEHRRCIPAISDCFIDIAQYSSITNKTVPDQDLEDLFSATYEKALSFINVPGDSQGKRNVNFSEAKRIKSILLELQASGVDITTQVGIITPFQNQSIYLQSELRNMVAHTFQNKKIGTIHAFQGTEFDIIILSMVVFNDKFNVSFIDTKPNMLNVAISRAKYRLIVVGDYNFLSSSKGNIKKLLDYCELSLDE